MDVVTAFLQSHLKEEIYMKPPEEFFCNKYEKYRLRKSLYVLKQASRAWNIRLSEVLKEIDLKQSIMVRLG